VPLSRIFFNIQRVAVDIAKLPELLRQPNVALSSRKDFAKLRPHFRTLEGSRKTKESLEI
jgi:hypothetical protein